MGWVRVDDGFPSHPKVLPLSDAAFRLEVASWCHCNRNATNGRLTHRDVGILFAHLQNPDDGPQAVQDLLDAKLWESAEGGYKIHDYKEYQPTAEQRKAANDKTNARMKRYRERQKAADPTSERHGYAVTAADGYGVTNGAVTRPQPNPTQPNIKNKNTPLTPPGGTEIQAGLPLAQPSESSEPKRKPTKREIHTQTAIPILAYLSDARRSINPNCPRMQPTEANLKHIVARLAAGETPDRLRHVVDVWAALVRSDKRQFEFFNAVSPFRADNIAQYTEMSLEDARKPPTSLASAARPSLPQPAVWQEDDPLAKATRIPTGPGGCT